MPSNEVKDVFCNLFELKDFSRAAGPVTRVADIFRGQIIDKDIANGGFKLKNLNAQQVGVVSSRNFYANHPAVRNGFQVELRDFQGMQNQQGLFLDSLDFNQNNIISGVSSGFKFQQENDSVGSPTLTTNSERSEITEASTEFCLQRRQQNNFSVQQHLFPQNSPMQQSGFDEMQLLQQQVLLKQFQVLQRQQQLQQQNLLNPFSPAHRQASIGQFPPLVDGMPLDYTPQGYMDWPQRSASPAPQGTLNRTLFSMGLGSQQLDASLYGAPIANARGNVGPQSPMQAMYQDSSNLAAKSTGQMQKPVTHLSDFSNPFLKDQYNFSPAQVSLQPGASMSNFGFQGKGMPVGSPVHGLNDGLLSGDLVLGNSQQISKPSSASSESQGQVSWSSVQQKGTKPSQGLVPLDPLEEKILFNMEDSSISEIASGVFGDKYDNVNFTNSFSSIQSGSWSALMQSAVAEASISDTGVQEKFSGLTHQNMELLADNSMSKFIDSDKQQTGWMNGSLPGSALFAVEPLEVANYPDVNSSFTGFQLLSDQQRVSSGQDGGTTESTQRSPKVIGRWVDCNPQHKLSVGGNRQVRPNVHFNDSSEGKMHSSKILDQVDSGIGNLAASADTSSASIVGGMPNSFQSLTSSLDLSQGGKWENLSYPLGRTSVFPDLIRQNDPATMSASSALSGRSESQVQMVNLPDNASQMSIQAGLPRQDVARQFNVWMDLPARQDPLDEQESSKVPLNTSKSSSVLLGNNVLSWQKAHGLTDTYNVSQTVGLPQAKGPSADHISVLTASTKDFLHVNTVGDAKVSSMVEAGKSQNIQIPSQNQLSDVCSSGMVDLVQNQSSSSMEHGHLSSVNDADVHAEQEHDAQDTMNQSMDIIISKKRKLMAPPWHEEATHVSKRHQTLSDAGQEWAQVTNRLFEKGEYEIWKVESIQRLPQSKRRLVQTVQFMQQLFCPAPAFILLSDVASSYASVLYFVARATLGDACSITHKGQDALPSSSIEVNELFEKIKTNERRRDRQYAEVARELTEKIKKVEGDLERLEKAASMAEIKIEIEDLERFAVMNRFARFHSRAPPAGNSGPTMPKPIPRRYITASLSHRNLPEGVQCLSL
ncbi:PREDICTED: uncharacterized protein LOC104820999 [Tarenaya hassleriana]|uniref:uncharacterized protein LOC104820999 n=1 Tax=Tarenaya hassleriana TaxID=28532 RepID=UPI00053C2D81|nr:PREDICTED: uncharacterized protein LOC104820999 [Tarenaya hassleriana]